MSNIPTNEQWKYRNSVPQINLLTPCQPPNQVQFSRDWNFYLSPQELVTRMTQEELAAYDKSLAPSLNQLRVNSSIQNYDQITVSRKTVATDDQNTEQIVGTEKDIPAILQTQENVSLAAPKLIKPPVNGIAQLTLLNNSAGQLTTTPGLFFSSVVVTQQPGGGVSNTFNNVPTLTSGSGSGAILDIVLVGGNVTNAVVVNPGLGYQVGDLLTVTAVSLGTPDPLVFQLQLNSFASTTLEGGFGFPIGFTRKLDTKSLTGCGVELTVSVDAPSSSVTGVYICDQGEEYKTGDKIEIINPNEGQLITTDNVLLSSIVIPLPIFTTNGTYSNVNLVNVSSSGSGAVVEITISGAQLLTGIVVTSPGSGYKIGDTLQVPPGVITNATALVITLGYGDVASNAQISVDILAPAPLATTQTDGFIQMDQGGFQLPSGPWGAQLGIVALRYTGGSINGSSQNRIVVETCQPHGLNSCDKVTINGVDQFGSSNHFDVISIHDANKFEINNPYEYGILPVGTSLNAVVDAHRQKSSIDQAGLSVPYRSAVSKTIQKQVFSTTELYACTEVGCNNQNYDFSNVDGKTTAAGGIPAQSIYNDPPPILQPPNFRGPVATSFGVSKQLNASELAMLQLNSVPFPL
tara:strand:+ start:872 stop:2770 length:1899 start_codon:yes stop_codon:yes gene_type:complete